LLVVVVVVVLVCQEQAEVVEAEAFVKVLMDHTLTVLLQQLHYQFLFKVIQSQLVVEVLEEVNQVLAPHREVILFLQV
jgi:hypothetical protein